MCLPAGSLRFGFDIQQLTAKKRSIDRACDALVEALLEADVHLFLSVMQQRLTVPRGMQIQRGIRLSAVKDVLYCRAAQILTDLPVLLGGMPQPQQQQPGMPQPQQQQPGMPQPQQQQPGMPQPQQQ